MTRATFLLPAPSRFGAQRWTADVVRALGRADRLPDGDAGRRAQLLRFAHLQPGRWPLAALSRRLDAQDADAPGIAWLRAHPQQAWQAFIKRYPELDTPLNHQAWHATLPYFATHSAEFNQARYQAFGEYMKANGLIATVAPLARYSL